VTVGEEPILYTRKTVPPGGSMPSPRHVRIGFGLLFATLVVAGAAEPVRAACGVTAEAVRDAEVAFVGTLTGVSADGLTGTFDVEEVWRGTTIEADAPAVVEVATGGVFGVFEMPPDGSVARYLVLAAATDDGELHTGRNCSVFPFPWADSYSAFQPTDRPGLAPGFDTVLLVAGIAVVGGLFVLALRGSRLVP
jgi:hypothetical protein